MQTFLKSVPHDQIKWGKGAQKIENLQQPECTALHTPADGLTYCELGTALFWLGVRFETGNGKVASWCQTISYYIQKVH